MGRVKTAFFLSTALLLTGCATTAKGISQSAVMKSSLSETLRQDVPPGTVMAVLRYPAHVEDDAKQAYYDAYSARTIGGKLSKDKSDAAEIQALADGMVMKSNYYALSMYKEMAAKMPEHSVLLSPHVIKLGADGALTSVPMTQAESLPSVVTVDFTSYSFPDAKKMMGKAPLTFGDLVTPLVTVHSDHRASAPTQGLRLASAPLLQHSAGNGRRGVGTSLAALQNGNFETSAAPLDFIAYLNAGSTARVPSQSFGTMSPNAVTSFPLEKIQLDKKEIAKLSAKDGGVTDPLRTAFSAGFANQVIGIINRTDVNKATMVRRAAAIAQYDPSLAALTIIGSDDADYQARYRYAERLLQAEQKYLSVQSLRLFDGVHNGEIGAQSRDMLKAEYEHLEKRRELARQQNINTSMAILGVLATGAMIANGGVGQDCSRARSQREYYECQRRNQAANKVLTDVAIAGIAYTGSKAFSLNKQSKMMGTNYLSSVSSILEQQQTVQVNLIDSNETITAIRFEDLRSKLQTLYSEKQRSLETVATRCGYTHDGSVKSGTWLGVCENGLANGAGVGVLRHADGSAVEYYGYAVNGQPQGAGYMITHTASGSSALEGNFTAGRADGAMRKTTAGEASRIASYSAGEQTGRAPVGVQVATPFGATFVSMPSAGN